MEMTLEKAKKVFRDYAVVNGSHPDAFDVLRWLIAEVERQSERLPRFYREVFGVEFAGAHDSLMRAKAVVAEVERQRERADIAVEGNRRLHAQLAECYRLTGADPDGNEDWRLAQDAVAEVRRMRREMDERKEHGCHAIEDEHRAVVNRVAEALSVVPTMDTAGNRSLPRSSRCFEIAEEFWLALQAHWKEQA